MKYRLKLFANIEMYKRKMGLSMVYLDKRYIGVQGVKNVLADLRRLY